MGSLPPQIVGAISYAGRMNERKEQPIYDRSALQSRRQYQNLPREEPSWYIRNMNINSYDPFWRKRKSKKKYKRGFYVPDFHNKSMRINHNYGYGYGYTGPRHKYP